MGKITLFIFTLLATFNFTSINTEIKEAYKKSDVVFIGKIIAKEIKQTPINVSKINAIQNYIRTVYTFEIIELFKGQQKSKTIKITTKYNAFNFKMGDVYLTYAYLSKYLLSNNFYINNETVIPFLAVKKPSRIRPIEIVSKKELKKLRKYAKRERKNQK